MSSLSGNPFSIAAADVAAAPLIIWVGVIHILQVEFQGYIADTDTCTILDTSGRVVWFGNGASDLQTVRSGHIGNVVGLKINTAGITNGNVRIYYK